ncbi:DUF4089 domain-containing protein [Ferrovibrio sp.]|uniref:DUF4089 domain-containing protein n=1 Tax=Ferrovibrio sp. TaxID=1917215 RepID=UPI003D0DE6CF
MKNDEFDAEVFVRQSAALTGFTITPEQMPGVVTNIKRIVPLAKLFVDFPLPDDVELASVFEP